MSVMSAMRSPASACGRSATGTVVLVSVSWRRPYTYPYVATLPPTATPAPAMPWRNFRRVRTVTGVTAGEPGENDGRRDRRIVALAFDVESLRGIRLARTRRRRDGRCRRRPCQRESHRLHRLRPHR